MAYLGQTPADRYIRIDRQTITGNGGTSYTLNYYVANENELEVYVNNVRQEPGNAYTTVGTTLNMTGAVTANDSFYVVYQGKAVGSIGIPEKQVDGTYLFTSNVAIRGNLSVGTGTTIITNDAVTTSNLSVNGSAVTPVTGFKNVIINGNFDFWQRGTSVTGVTDGQFVADRWNSGRGGTTANVSQQSFTVGQTAVPGEPTYFHRSVVTSVAGAGNYYILRQSIESIKTFAGQTATLSFWAKADASKNIAVEFVQYFGTGGSPSSQIFGIGVTTCALTTAWKKFTVTVNIPSISGKTLGSDNNDCLVPHFWFDAGSNWNSRTNSLGQQSGTFDIAQVQLEAGPVATPFEQRPLGQELALCQRYYETGRCDGAAAISASADLFGPRVCFASAKRVSPTISVSFSYNGNMTTGTGSGTYGINTQGFTPAKASAGSSGQAGVLYDASWTASAEL